jgi:methionine-rich copper-binding protein CopC
MVRPAALALAAACLAAQPAAAHAVLVDSTPAPLSHVPAGHIDLVFRYNSRIDAGRSKLTLKRADGTSQRLPSLAADRPDVLKAALDLTQGDYTVSWQVLAKDGHITRGNVPFTVDAQGAGTGH